MTTLNQQYYTDHAQSFFDATVDINMQVLYAQFLPYIPAGGLILDAGCGAGRDSRSFLELGYKVQAFDASKELVSLASQLIKQPVRHALFQTFNSNEKFDGIWACASLLHVSMDELPTVFTKLVTLLSDGGALYCSFKLGDEEVTRNGREFTNVNEQSFSKYIEGLPITIVKQWRTGDLRAGRETELWLNTILRKDIPNGK